MRIFVGVTDKDWFSLHASRANIDEVNFWRPSPTATFKALKPGELFLFKLHAPDNYIVDGGFFTKFQQLPVNLAWDAFREANGVTSLIEMRERIAFYRRSSIAFSENPTIGCILLAEPFFWPKNLWISSPDDFKSQTVQGKGYEAEAGSGRSLWNRLFDEGYITIDPAERRILVSKRIREEFENGKEYYCLDGQVVRDPLQAFYRPLSDNLDYHARNVFR